MNTTLKITCILSIIANFIASTHAMKRPINRGQFAKQANQTPKKAQQTQKESQPFRYSNLSEWMTEASSKSAKFKNLPLRKIIMPGSHDSGTYAFNSRSKIGDDHSLPLQLNKIPGVGFAISRYAKTQNLNLTQQLEAGVRYLDFRVLREDTKSGASQFYLIHGLKGNTLEHSLNEVLQFCKSHPGEKIIIDMNHLYGFRSQEDHNKLIELTKSKLGKLLARRNRKTELTIADMNKNKESIILIYHNNDTANKHNELWYKSTISSPWLDSRNIDELINGLRTYQRYYDGTFYVTQYIITPDVKYILKHPLATLRKITLKTTHARLDEFLNGINLDKTNIIIMDFINTDITRKIIDLNKKKI